MLSVITLTEEAKWDAIVKTFSNWDVYYLSNYTKAFKLHGDGEPLLIYYENEDFKAINVVMKRDIEDSYKFKGKIAAKTFYDITTPYGYGGFIMEGNTTEENIGSLKEAYSNYCISNNIISEFIRFNPVLKNSALNETLYEVTDLGPTITMNLTSKEQIWSDISSKNRNVIRKAKKSGVEIFWGRSPELKEQFIPLYNATMDKDFATSYYYFKKEFYDSVIKDLKYNSMFFYALYEQKIISMSIILFGNEKMHYHLSASNKEYQSFAPTNLLLYEAACWGCENGYKEFHLGGGLGSKEDSLYKFKKSFSKTSETYFSIGKKIFDKVKYDKLVDISNNSEWENKDSNFFPQYRK